MSDRSDKFPPRPPCRPCGPWPSVFPYDKDYPGDRPPRPPQPVPGNMWWNDTEPVMGVYPWETCCSGDEDPCLCITSGEVDVWNQTYSAVSGSSAEWNRAVDDSWRDSADNWQSTYDTVSASSASWNRAYEIASAWNSGANESIYAIVSATSSFLTTYSADPYINVNSAYFTGNGSPDHPLDFTALYKWWANRVTNAMNDLYEDGSWGESEHRKFVTDKFGEYLMEWIQYHDNLMWEVSPSTTSPSGEPRSREGGIFYQLEKLWNVVNGGSTKGDEAYDCLVENSGKWDSSHDVVLENSANWDGTYEAVSSNSADWNESYEAVSSNSGVWDSTQETVSANSADWNASFETVSANSGVWDSTYEAVSANSGYWNDVYDTVSTTSGNLESVYSTVEEHSAKWEIGDDSWKNSADNWQSSYETVESYSASWSSVYDTIEGCSGDWTQTSATVHENSAYWSSGSHETWLLASDMTIQNASSFNRPDTIYFNFRG